MNEFLFRRNYALYFTYKKTSNTEKEKSIHFGASINWVSLAKISYWISKKNESEIIGSIFAGVVFHW